MSRSNHTTNKNLRGLTKLELNEQFNDHNSDLAILAVKSTFKKKILKDRKQKKPNNSISKLQHHVGLLVELSVRNQNRQCRQCNHYQQAQQ